MIEDSTKFVRRGSVEEFSVISFRRLLKIREIRFRVAMAVRVGYLFSQRLVLRLRFS